MPSNTNQHAFLIMGAGAPLSSPSVTPHATPHNAHAMTPENKARPREQRERSHARVRHARQARVDAHAPCSPVIITPRPTRFPMRVFESAHAMPMPLINTAAAARAREHTPRRTRRMPH